jgi:hypothetical protein
MEMTDWFLIQESDITDINDLFALYKESPFEARVIYMMNKNKYVSTRVVKFIHGSDFQIAVMQRTYGISKTNRIYNREICKGAISYSKGKFHLMKRFRNKKHIEQLTHLNLRTFLVEVVGAGYDKHKEHAVYKMLVSEFGWIRFLDENYLLQQMCFNTVVNNKLYSLNTALRFLFKAPLPAIKVWIAAHDTYERPKVHKLWTELRKVLYNIENMRLEMVQDGLFLDTCRMAGTLNKRVNCSWSLKRLKLEHDKWGCEITQVILKHEKLRDLNISRVFLDFEAFSGYRLLRTNHEMIAEGIMQNHCVGTYSGQVDGGNTAIYHINGYTLQLTYGQNYYTTKSKGLYNAQFRGPSNTLAPKELADAVSAKITEFNGEGLEYEFAQINTNELELPF